MKLTNKKSIFTVLMACLLVLGTCLTACGAKDPLKYARYVEKEAIESAVEGFADAYDAYIAAAKLTENQEFKTAGKMNMDIEISESALSMLEVATAASGAELDLSWLSNISFDADVYLDKDLYSYGLMLGLSDSDLIGLDFIMNLKDSVFYLGVPEILSKYISVDFGALMAETDMAEVFQTMYTMPDLSRLPDGATIEKLLDRYIDIVLNGIKTVEMTDGTTVAQGVEVPCNVLVITVTESDAMAIAEAVLTEARNDKELEEVIVAVVDFLADYVSKMPTEETIPSGAECYAELCDAIDEALADIEEAKAETTADDVEEEALIIRNYVNKDDEIIGRTLTLPDGTEAFSYIYAENRGNFGFELYVEGENVLYGSGTKSKTTLNGTFTVMADGEEAVTFTLKDIGIDKLEDGLFSGTVDINAEALAEMANDSVISSIFGNYTIRLEMNTKSLTEAELSMGLVDASDNYFVKLTCGVSMLDKDAKAPEIPAAENVIEIDPEMDDAESEQLAMELLTSINVDVIRDRLNASPIPEEYVELIDRYLAYIDLIMAYQSMPQ